MNTFISVDPATSWLCELDAAQWRRPLSPERSAAILKHRDAYSQLAKDNRNLIWLYTLMLEEEIELPQGEVISSMKRLILAEGSLRPRAWRYIANGTATDFRVVLDSQPPGEEEPKWRWHALIAWLKVLSGLRRRSPVPEPIQEFFLHDGLVADPDNDEVQFRGAWMKFITLRHILEEAERRMSAGVLRQFAENELVEVITWLAATDPDLKKNQSKNGWKYLSKEAARWKADTMTLAAYQDLQWDSALPRMQIGPWAINPVLDAWSLHRLAISQRHCGDRYIEGCIAGTERIFIICDIDDKTLATLRLEFVHERWEVADVRGFANSAVPAEIMELAELLAKRYRDLNSRAV